MTTQQPVNNGRMLEYNSHQKAATVAWLMFLGREFTTREIATMFGMSHTGAWYMMENISGAFPITQDEKTTKWRLVD